MMKNEKLAVVSGVKEVSDLSRMSDDLSVGLASSIASVVSGPAVERGVNLAVQLAHVIFIEDGDVRSFLKAIFFVAGLARGSISRLGKHFVHSADVASGESFVRKRVENTLE